MMYFPSRIRLQGPLIRNMIPAATESNLIQQSIFYSYLSSGGVFRRLQLIWATVADRHPVGNPQQSKTQVGLLEVIRSLFNAVLKVISADFCLYIPPALIQSHVEEGNMSNTCGSSLAVPHLWNAGCALIVKLVFLAFKLYFVFFIISLLLLYFLLGDADISLPCVMMYRHLCKRVELLLLTSYFLHFIVFCALFCTLLLYFCFIHDQDADIPFSSVMIYRQIVMWVDHLLLTS